MIKCGDCLSCEMLGTCPSTSYEKVRDGYTCAIFKGAPEPVYLARLALMGKYGEEMAIQAMLNRPKEVEEA